MVLSIQILDGGLGTTLEERYGVKFSQDTTPLWSSDVLVRDPATLAACQGEFARAGVDVLTTATYQVSVEGFARTKTAEHPDGIPRSAIGPYLRRAVDIAEQALAQGGGDGAIGGGGDGDDDAVLPDGGHIALGLGPYGACMVPGQEYTGRYDPAHDSEEALFAWHLDRLRLFTAEPNLLSRVRYLAFETLPRLDEIRAVRRAVHAAGLAHMDFWVSAVFPGHPADTLRSALPAGGSIEQVVESMLGPLPAVSWGGVDVEAALPWGIGVNCTKMHKLPHLIRTYEAHISHMINADLLRRAPALVAYPDGTDHGETYNPVTQTWERPAAGGARAHEQPRAAGAGARDEDWPRAEWDSQLANAVLDAQARWCFKAFLVGGCCKARPDDIRALADRFRSPPPAHREDRATRGSLGWIPVDHLPQFKGAAATNGAEDLPPMEPQTDMP